LTDSFESRENFSALIRDLPQKLLPDPRHGPDQAAFLGPVFQVLDCPPHHDPAEGLVVRIQTPRDLTASQTWAVESRFVALRSVSRMILPVSPLVS
jgi:hypothetical protein